MERDAGRAAAHLPGFDRSPLSRIVALCDLDREQAETQAARFGIPEVVTDYQELLARPDIDVIDVVTRADHKELVFAVLEAGKPLSGRKGLFATITGMSGEPMNWPNRKG